MIVITGGNGQLGTELKYLLDQRNIPYIAADIDEMDITKEDDVRAFLTEVNATTIYHCAAYTAVDRAEDEGKELNHLVNVVGTKNVATVAAELGATIVYLSTDYVFDGTKLEEYTIEDEVNPKSEYGRSKYEGEVAIMESGAPYYIVRTSWVFGQYGHNFVFTMQNLAKTRDTLTVVNDQHGRPTWTRNLAEFMTHLVDSHAEHGLYFFSNDNNCTWFDFATEILKDTDVTVLPVTSDQFPQKAYRPKHSVMDLSKAKATGFHIPTWQEALETFLGQIDGNK